LDFLLQYTKQLVSLFLSAKFEPSHCAGGCKKWDWRVEWILGAVQKNTLRDGSTGTRNMKNCKVAVRRGGSDMREEQDPIIYIYIYIYRMFQKELYNFESV
jgi:hypothetical protein